MKTATRRERLEGGEPSVWDELSRANEPEMSAAGLYPLRSAPERAILRAVEELTRLGPGDSFAEFGCGAARYLPYIACDIGVRVAGVDFSEEGVEQTRRALQNLGVDASAIELGDIKAYAPRHAGEFDAVASFGLIEHFSDLDAIIDLHLLCTKPGGRVFVSAPNLAGPNLWWTRQFSHSILDWHCEISAEKVVYAFRAKGAREIEIRHLGGPRLFAYPEGGRGGRAGEVAARVGRKVFNGGGEAIYRLAPRVATRLGGRSWSPYFAVACTKP